MTEQDTFQKPPLKRVLTPHPKKHANSKVDLSNSPPALERDPKFVFPTIKKMEEVAEVDEISPELVKSTELQSAID